MSSLSEFKVILVGERGVGKTSLIIRFAENKYYEHPKTTIRVDIETVNLDINGKECLMHIHDTGGQETFWSLGTSFFRETDGVIFVYDETRPATFDKISDWFKLIEKHCDDKIVKIIAGNKTDDKEGLRVHHVKVKSFAQSNDVEVIKTSAKEDTNVKEVFLRLTKMMSLSKGIVQAGIEPMIKIVEPPHNLLKAIDDSRASYRKERRSRFLEERGKHLKRIRLCTPSDLDPTQHPKQDKPAASRCPCYFW